MPRRSPVSDAELEVLKVLWAAGPSTVRAVHLSFISFVFQWPVLIMGSMVKIIPGRICGPSPRTP